MVHPRRAILLLLLACLLLFGTSAGAQCVTTLDRTGVVNGAAPPWNVRMVYDTAGQRCLAIDTSTPTRTFACDGVNWTTLAQTGQIPPSPRYGGAWVYDSTRHVGLLFSGSLNCGGCTPSNTLFAFSGSNWQQLSWTGATPPQSYGAYGAFDPRRGRAIFIVWAGTAADLWDTWEWTGSGWERGPRFGPVSIDSFAFDTVRNVGFLTGSSASNGVVYPEAVWEYTPGATAALGSWRHVTITGTPYEASITAGLVFDPYRGRMMRCFGRGSLNSSYTSQIAVWDVAASTWIRVNFAESLPESVPRGASGLAFDLARDVLVIYGGGRILPNTGQFQSYQDTWEQKRFSPGIAAQPTSATVDGGQTAIFAATPVGADLSLQWLRDGVAVPGATGPIIAVQNASQATAGLYVLRATNTCGQIDSLPARLTVRPPVNDIFLNPTSVFSATISGATSGATPDGTAPCGNSNASPDVWYKYTAPYDGSLSMDTCGSDFDTVLSLHSCCSGTPAAYACSDDNPPAGCDARASSLTTAVTQGQQFLVRVSGYQGASGHFALNTRLVPFNNACASATPVFAGTYSGTTVGATADGTASCVAPSTTPDIWYRFRSDCSGALTLDTAGSSFDTILSVRSGCPGAELACNDDVQPGTLYSYLTVTVQPGADYYIRVSGYAGATGAVVLHVNPPHVPGDTCDEAVPIGLGLRTFATRCASTSSLALPPWCVQAASGVPFYDRWFRYLAGAPGTVEVRVCNTSFQPVLAVYGALCPTSPYDAITCSAGTDLCGSNPLASVPTGIGSELLIRVGGYYGLGAGLAGSGELEVTLVPFETGACCLSAGCVVTSQYECTGTFLGAGAVCATPPCASLLGACCTGTSCAVLSTTACSAGGGVFGGSSTTCGLSPQNPVTCCPANFDGIGGLAVTDIFAFLNAWFAAEPRADFNRTDGLGVSDIFAFLNAWFAGC